MLAVLGLILAALLQSTVVEVLPVKWPMPELVSLLVLSLASLNGRLAGLRAAVVGGVCMDLMSANPLGLSTLGLMPGAYIAGWVREQLPESTFVTSLSTVVLGTVFVSLTQTAYLVFSGGAVSWQAVMLRLMLPLAVTNGLLAVLVLPLLNSIVEAPEREPTAFIRRTLPKGIWQ